MQDTSKFIPFALPSIDQEEIDAVASAIRSGWLTTGPKTKEFESAFASAVGAKHALAVNSWTAGAHLAMEAMGVKEGDVVITPTWTFTATAEVSRYLGAHPYFVDVDRESLNISVEQLEAAILKLRRQQSHRVVAIAPVHFAGQPCDMNSIVEIAGKYNLKIIEDAAHAFPASSFTKSVNDNNQRQRSIGSIGHATSFSFYATKPLATGEGGMVTTDDDQIAERVRVMRLHGISRDVWNRYHSKKPSWYYEVVAPGFKYNLTDIASAIGIVQLKKSDMFRKRRAEIASQYSEAFRNNCALEIPTPPDPKTQHAWHLYVIRLNLSRLDIDRDRFIHEMSLRGIGCSVHFIPLHLQPYWRNAYKLKPELFPVATAEFERCVSLPIYPSMTDQEVARVVEAVTDITAKFQKRASAKTVKHP